MRRIETSPRLGWQSTVESQGLHFHSPDGAPYWNESSYYTFTSEEIDAIDKATYALNDMCLKAVEYIFDHAWFQPFNIPAEYHAWLRKSWDEQEHTIYGRFDLALSPDGIPKLLEYNADTPTSLLEAAVVQWYWFQDTKLGSDQFNGIHDRLIEAWQAFGVELEQPVYFASLADHVEDYMTVQYLRDTAMQAGLQTEYISVPEIRWNESKLQFVDANERRLGTVFKLYPWEWMLDEEFGPCLLSDSTRWLEAPWKMLLSNKAILAVLWHLFPQSPYLLQAGFEPIGSSYVEKPRQGREGANVRIVESGRVIAEASGDYDGETVFQAYTPLPTFDGHTAVIGSWLVNGHACGIGVREDSGMITRNTSRFVPHVIE